MGRLDGCINAAAADVLRDRLGRVFMLTFLAEIEDTMHYLYKNYCDDIDRNNPNSGWPATSRSQEPVAVRHSVAFGCSGRFDNVRYVFVISRSRMVLLE
jgi:hypothetical protein